MHALSSSQTQRGETSEARNRQRRQAGVTPKPKLNGFRVFLTLRIGKSPARAAVPGLGQFLGVVLAPSLLSGGQQHLCDFLSQGAS